MTDGVAFEAARAFRSLHENEVDLSVVGLAELLDVEVEDGSDGGVRKSERSLGVLWVGFRDFGIPGFRDFLISLL